MAHSDQRTDDGHDDAQEEGPCVYLILDPSPESVAAARQERCGRCVRLDLCASRTGVPLPGDLLAIVFAYLPLAPRRDRRVRMGRSVLLHLGGRLDMRFE